MVSILGKRKSRHGIEINRSPSPTSSASSNSANNEYLDAFRQAFEAKFKPLNEIREPKKEADKCAELQADDSFTDSDWEGFDSEADELAADYIEVVDHGTAHKPERLSKAEARAFMNSKPPRFHQPKSPADKSQDQDERADDDDNEELNLKNDLALQRLINESHLLDKIKDDGTVFGRREKRLDLRIQAIGAKSSILNEHKMPMSHRKGIVAKAKEREERRRREARESGIILEKPTKPKKSSNEEKRLRGVGGPSIGKFKNGTLRLSKRDVAEIKGPAGKGKMLKSRHPRNR